jgi:hypothetical protein
MIKRLDRSAITRRTWNGRDDIHQNYFGRVPLTEVPVSISLTWKKTKGAVPCLVGRFELDLKALSHAGYVRKMAGFYFLRFQRTGTGIELAQNRRSIALLLGQLPKEY